MLMVLALFNWLETGNQWSACHQYNKVNMTDPLHPPTVRDLPTREEVETSCQTWAMKHGYTLTV